MESLIINDTIKKSRIPARLDLAQSGTGLFLGLFMWVHMFLVASILLGKGSFYFVAKTMELSFLSSTGHGYPSAVFLAVLVVFTIFIIHAALGARKFPISFRQHAIIRDQMGMLKHADTNLWYIQAVTGFAMFFLGSVHLYVMLTHPGQIGPYLSADRFVSSGMWPLYLVLLVCVELHGTIGLYRLCMKWGWLSGKDARQSRKKLKQLKERITLFFLGLGGLAFVVFVIIGIGHRDRAGQPYVPKLKAVTPVQAAPAPAVETEKPATIPAETHSPETRPETDSHASPAVHTPGKAQPEAGVKAHEEAAPVTAPVKKEAAHHEAVAKPESHPPVPAAHTASETVHEAPVTGHGEADVSGHEAPAPAGHTAETDTHATEGAGHGDAKQQHKE